MVCSAGFRESSFSSGHADSVRRVCASADAFGGAPIAFLLDSGAVGAPPPALHSRAAPHRRALRALYALRSATAATTVGRHPNTRHAGSVTNDDCRQTDALSHAHHPTHFGASANRNLRLTTAQQHGTSAQRFCHAATALLRPAAAAHCPLPTARITFIPVCSTLPPSRARTLEPGFVITLLEPQFIHSTLIMNSVAVSTADWTICWVRRRVRLLILIGHFVLIGCGVACDCLPPPPFVPMRFLGCVSDSADG